MYEIIIGWRAAREAAICLAARVGTSASTQHTRYYQHNKQGDFWKIDINRFQTNFSPLCVCVVCVSFSIVSKRLLTSSIIETRFVFHDIKTQKTFFCVVVNRPSHMTAIQWWNISRVLSFSNQPLLFLFYLMTQNLMTRERMLSDT